MGRRLILDTTALIAAHAIETGRTILSTDTRARFGDLPDVEAFEV